MKVLIYKSFFFYILLLLLAETNLYAQWKEAAHNLFGSIDSLTGTPTTQGGRGALFFSDGIIWAGVNSLFSSDDSAKSWQKIPFPALSTTLIRDIYFSDKWNGLIATSDEGVLLTRDGGQSWKTILTTTGDIWKASFNGSTNIIHALGVDQGICYTSLDGGLSWEQSVIGPFVSCLAIAPDHTVYVFAQEYFRASTRGWIAYSTDFGSTWTNSSGLVDGDSYTLSVDSCERNRLYLLNEDWASSNNWMSEVFVTSDKGSSWQSYHQQEVPYFTGPLVAMSHSLYAGTVSDDGILRSTDKGISWQSIGGPPTEGDSRTIAAINDNIVLVLDTKGNIYSTFNSGGNELSAVSAKPPLQFSSARIINDTSNIVIHLPIYFHHVVTEWDADIAMHYRTFSLKFLGTELYNGKSFDVPGSQWPGRSLLHFNSADLNAAPDSLLGYVNFLWTPLELDCNEIEFDSISTVDPCTSIQRQIFKGVIGSSASCEESFVTTAPPKDQEPDFSLSPNPAGDYTLLSPVIFSGNITGKLYDIGGRLISSFEAVVAHGNPVKIPLNNLASGVYHLSIQGNGVQSELSFVKQ